MWPERNEDIVGVRSTKGLKTKLVYKSTNTGLGRTTSAPHGGDEGRFDEGGAFV